MADDYEEVLSLPEGIFRVKYHKLNVQAIRSLRSRWINEAFKLRREIASLNSQIRYKKAVLKQRETMISNLTEEKIQSLIAKEEQKQQEIQGKADKFLLEVIGPVAFEELQSNGSFVFFGLDKKKYRIKKDGLLQCAQGKWWYNCCYLKPSQLPLPDIIASVISTVRTSSRFPKETNLKKTKEEVTE